MTKAYLVGAGPGDPRLLTIAAFEAIQTADVVLSDRLVSDEILALVNPAAEMIYVGKEEGEQEKTQNNIFDYFAKFAASNMNVVRLKGGDPYIFGRGCEEYTHLKKLGYEIVIIPGVSTAIGLPTLVGIPLTARNISSSFAVITGHSANDQSVNWHDYIKIDTLVILMAVKERVRIAEALIAAGRDASEPIAFIENGSLRNQRVIKSTLVKLKAGEVEVSSPAVLVVGWVSALPESAQLVEQLGLVIEEKPSAPTLARKPMVEIEYCPKCRWLLRSAWMAQELLTTFEADVGGVSLQPSLISGAFEVRVNGKTVWSRSAQGRFPEIKELKRLVRDVAAPEKDLGHSER